MALWGLSSREGSGQVGGLAQPSPGLWTQAGDPQGNGLMCLEDGEGNGEEIMLAEQPQPPPLLAGPGTARLMGTGQGRWGC